MDAAAPFEVADTANERALNVFPSQQLARTTAHDSAAHSCWIVCRTPPSINMFAGV
jgi:hypothetical protein